MLRSSSFLLQVRSAFAATLPLLALGRSVAPFRSEGSPGRPVIRVVTAKNVPRKQRSHDIVVQHMYDDVSNKLLHYLGKHVAYGQKSLWSPDTPVPQDRALYKLTTLDIDGFKYWFGVKRALIRKPAWKIFMKAGLLPPSIVQHNRLARRPIFSKEELYRYYLGRERKKQAPEGSTFGASGGSTASLVPRLHSHLMRGSDLGSGMGGTKSQQRLAIARRVAEQRRREDTMYQLPATGRVNHRRARMG